jgi:hypothetical protein
MSKKCDGCDGSGIMTLYPMGWKAPCVVCSPARKLSDLERERDQKLVTEDQMKIRRAIREHNKRIEELERTP